MTWQSGLTAGLDHLKGLSEPKQFYVCYFEQDGGMKAYMMMLSLTSN